jgi:hypothetical protein
MIISNLFCIQLILTSTPSPSSTVGGILSGKPKTLMLAGMALAAKKAPTLLLMVSIHGKYKYAE